MLNNKQFCIALAAMLSLVNLPVQSATADKKETAATAQQKTDSTTTNKPYQFSEDWTTFHTVLWKKQLQPLKGKPGLNALEVGSFEGRSAIWLLDNILTDKNAHLTCIDIFWNDPQYPNYEARFDKNIKLSGWSSKVTKIKAPSNVALRPLKLNSYDLIYIDGSHTALDVLKDTILSWDLLKDGGIMIFDDYKWKPNAPELDRPQPALDAFLHIFAPNLDVLHKGYQLIVKKHPSTVKLPDLKADH